MNRFILTLLAITLSGTMVLSVPSNVFAQNAVQSTAAIDSKVMEIIQSSSEFLAAKKTLKVGWFVTYDINGTESRQESRTWGGEALLGRGKGYYAVSERDEATKEYFYDGETFTAKNVNDRYYATLPISGPYDQMAITLRDNHGLTLPLWELLSANLTDDLLADVTRAHYIGKTRVMGQWAHHVSFSEPGLDWEMWIAADEKRPVPLMMVGRYDDAEKSNYHALFHMWDFKPRHKRRVFKFSPKAKELKMDFSKLRELTPAGGDFGN